MQRHYTRNSPHRQQVIILPRKILERVDIDSIRVATTWCGLIWQGEVSTPGRRISQVVSSIPHSTSPLQCLDIHLFPPHARHWVFYLTVVMLVDVTVY